MNLLISHDFKNTDVQHFISYHRWDNIISKNHHQLLVLLSKVGVIEHTKKDVLESIKSRLEYGGYSAELNKRN